MNTDKRLDALKGYIERTKQILDLSSPQLEGIGNPESYRVYLQDSFRKIGVLAQENNETLETCLLPLLEEDYPVTEEDVRLMREFSAMLIDTTRMENVDHHLIYLQAKRALAYAEKADDLRLRILAYDNMVIASYSMINLTSRLYPENDIFVQYREDGLRAANKLLEYLEPEEFAKLPDKECKTLVLINARYMRCLFEWDELEDKSEVNARDLEMLQHAIALADDPFYREQLPDYDWDRHIFRTLQYMSDLAEQQNKRGFTDGQLEALRSNIERLIVLLGEHPEYEEDCPKAEQRFYLLQSAYLTKRIGLDEYRRRLLALMDQRNPDDFSARGMFTIFVVSFEYLITYDGDKLSEPEKNTLTSLYRFIAGYAYRMPKTGVLSFMLTFIATILRGFIEIPGGLQFQEMCLKLLAAMHPPTYVHTLNVASLTRFLTDHLIDCQPELLVGEAGTKSVEEVLERRNEILEFAYHAALLHDVGKLFIVETIITYGRGLLDSERELLRVHTQIGAALLRRFPATAPYAEIALRHHRWYNNAGGYPDNIQTENVEHRVLVALVQVADCLDAGTDIIGRTYKPGKTPEENIKELREGRGTQYAPFAVDLFEDPAVVEELQTLLTEGRDENYRETYRMLKTL